LSVGRSAELQFKKEFARKFLDLAFSREIISYIMWVAWNWLFAKNITVDCDAKKFSCR